MRAVRCWYSSQFCWRCCSLPLALSSTSPQCARCAVNQQSISDAAAAAGALTAAETGRPRDVCTVTKAYVEINAPEVSALSGIDCTGWPSLACDPTVESVASDVQGGITVRITHPVTDANALMSSSAVGAVAQPASPADGTDPCERVGVEISSTWNTTFGRLAGVDSLDATVHTVAKASLAAGEDVPINLLVLDRTGCQSLLVAGNGGIVVAPILNPDVDGDPSNGLIPRVDGRVLQPQTRTPAQDVPASSTSMDRTRSSRPTGRRAAVSSSEATTHFAGLAAGAGCGQILTLAPGTPGCNLPSCSIGGGGRVSVAGAHLASQPTDPGSDRLPIQLQS